MMTEYTIPHDPSPLPSPFPNLEVEGGNLNVVLKKPEVIVLENRPIPTPGPTDILVKVMSTGM